MSTPVDQLWDAVLDGDEHRAGDVVLAALDDGVAAEAVLLDVVGAVQRRVGQEWAADRITVAQEHTATAINDRAVAVVGRHARVEPTGARVTVSCVDGEWHALPARLLAEVLRLRGFRVDHLGAQVPTPRLVEHLRRTAPDAVALSASIATRLPTAHAAILACRAAGVPVLAGGAAFGSDGRFARLLGAEGWAPDARTAADLLATGDLRPSGGQGQAVDDLPHLADQEYTLISRNASRLVRAVHGGLERHRPTAEEVDQIVAFLVTALYTGDDELFPAFLAWTASVLEARHVPAGVLDPALDLLGAELRDFPRASRLLAEAPRHATVPERDGQDD